MFEPVYSSQGGAPLGYRCRVLVEERFCGKLCKSYRGMQSHALAKHGMKIQMEMFDNVQEKANKLHAKSVRASSGNEALDGLFDALGAREAAED